MKRLFLFLLLVATVRGDGLTDLRATLQKLESDQPLRARIEVSSKNSEGESDRQKQQATGANSVIVESVPDGMRLGWSAEQIKQARKAAWDNAANPDAPKSGLATLGALSADDAANFLSAANPLRRWLEKAKLVEERADSFAGKPARLLVLQLDLRLNAEARKILKNSDATLKIWLDPNGVPLGLDRNINLRFSKYLLTYRIHEHDAREFQNLAGRLIVTRATHETTGSGLGHSEESHSTTTVTLLSD